MRIIDHCFVPHQNNQLFDQCAYPDCGNPEIEHEWTVEAYRANPEPMEDKRRSMKFIQIAVATDAENGEVLYAMGDDGAVYERTTVYYHPGKVYQGKSITRGHASTPFFWKKVELPFTEPELEERKFKLLEFQEEA